MLSTSSTLQTGKNVSPAAQSAGDVLYAVCQNIEGRFRKDLQPVIDFAMQKPAFSGNILEWHLYKNECPIDLSFRVNQRFDSMLFPEILESATTPALIRQGFNNIFNHAQNGFSYGIENVWLEFDAPLGGNPSLFFDIERYSNISVMEKAHSIGEVWSCFEKIRPSVTSEILQKIANLYLSALYAGIMLSREGDALRLTISGIVPDRLTEILDVLGWDGNLELLKKLQKTYIQSDHRIMISADFTDKIQPRIGIELSGGNMDVLINQLLENGLVNTDQYNSLKDWECTMPVPKQMRETLANIQGRSITAFYRRINHFKFVIEGDYMLAKAYLYYCF